MKLNIFIGFLAGVAVIVLSFFMLKSRHKTTEELSYERAANLHNLPVSEFRQIMEVMNRVETTRKFTDDDWEVVKTEVASDKLELRQCALVCCSYLRYRDPHRSEVIKFAKDYLASNQKAGNIPAVITLHSMRDPSWKEQALHVQQSPDPNTRSAITSVLDKFNENKK